ncbi:MAG: hypothetical protein AB8B63_18660 [Granulosicoccus sp.]
MKNRYVLQVVISLLVAISVCSTVFAQHDHSLNGAGHGSGHDIVNMPGLIGENASANESAELKLMFQKFQTISREVENLANGIRTVTWSTDPEVMKVLVSHATVMIDRVERLDDPKIRIQSPTLDLFFLRGDEIASEVEVLEGRLVVLQTSTNPDLVEALHTHAAEVTAMADRGMHAVHEMMVKQGRGH